MPEPLLLLGTGGNAYDVLDTVAAVNREAPTWEVIGFLDDARPAGSEHLGLRVLGRLREACRFDGAAFVNTIGSDASFLRLPEILAGTGLRREWFATVVHPAASVSARARLGQGVCVHHGVSVGGGAVIGDHVLLAPGCLLGHDTVVEDFALIAPGAVISGYVRIGRNSYIGAAASIRQRLCVGERSLVGMGAVVVRDVAAGATVVGNPARPLPR